MNIIRVAVFGISLTALATGNAMAQSSAQPVAGPDRTNNIPDGQMEAERANTEDGVREIVVTAQRRAERLQDIPISISAFPSESLKSQSISDSLDIAKLVPGLVINKNIGAAVPWLRGVGSVSSGFGTEMPVATYIDGFYLASPASGIFALNNIERIEVLKGPQGTLFGRNASAGVIQVITTDPSQASQLDAQIGYANYNTVSGSFYGSGPLGPDLAASMAFTGTDQGDGWGRNVVTGAEVFRSREFGVQAKLAWTPSASTSVTLQALHNDRRSDVGIAYGIAPGSVAVDGTPFLGRHNVASREDNIGRADQSLFGLRIEQDLDFARLVSLTSYQRIRSDFGFNLSGMPGTLEPGQSAINVDLLGTGRAFTQELQLLSPSDSPVSWILGAYYLHDRQTLDQVVRGICVGAACNGPPPILIEARQTSKSYAAFGQLTVTLLPALQFTGGLRYTRDEKDIGDSRASPQPGFPNSLAALPPSQLARPGLPFPGNPNGIPAKADWSKLTWRAALDYKFDDDIMVYVSANRGFKSGTYNITSFTNPPARPEILDAYEGGLKTTLFERKLRFNAAVFYYDYKDIQLRTSAPPAPPGQTILFNAAKSRVKGVEVDMQFVPSRQLTVNGAFTILDAKYVSFPGGTCVNPRPIGGAVLGGNVSTSCDRSGTRMIRAPKFAGTFGFIFRQPTDVGDLSLAVSDTYTSDFFYEPSNRVRQDAYHNVSASLTWESPDRKYDVQLWMKNLLDEFYYSALFEGANDTYSPGEPRSYGVRFGVHF